jgi:hypothetical protein
MIALPAVLMRKDRIRRAPRAQAEELEPVIRERLYGERHRIERVGPRDARRQRAARPRGDRTPVAA